MSTLLRITYRRVFRWSVITGEQQNLVWKSIRSLHQRTEYFTIYPVWYHQLFARGGPDQSKLLAFSFQRKRHGASSKHIDLVFLSHVCYLTTPFLLSLFELLLQPIFVPGCYKYTPYIQTTQHKNITLF